MTQALIRNRKGFTLLELVLASGLMVLIAFMVVAVVSFGNRFYRNNYSQYVVQGDVRLAMDSMVDNLRYATDLTVMPLATCKSEISAKQHYNYIYIENGAMHKAIYNSSSNNYFDTAIATALSGSSSSFTKVNDSTIQMTIAGLNGSRNYSLDSRLVLNNLQLLSKIVSTSGTGPYVAVRYLIQAP